MQVFLLFPHYCLGRGLLDLKVGSRDLRLEKKIFFLKITHFFYAASVEYTGRGDLPSPFNWTYLGRNLTAMFIVGSVSFLLVLMAEYKFFFKTSSRSAMGEGAAWRGSGIWIP